MLTLAERVEWIVRERDRLRAIAAVVVSQRTQVQPTINVSFQELVLQPASVQIVVQQQDVQLTLQPAIRVESPTVYVEPAQTTVNVAAPAVTVTPRIDVQSPTVNVAAPNVSVKPNILVESPTRKIKFTRNPEGAIIGAVSEPT